ncbi:hypothetical protein GGU45_003265 [Niabella hirudinis]
MKYRFLLVASFFLLSKSDAQFLLKPEGLSLPEERDTM